MSKDFSKSARPEGTLDTSRNTSRSLPLGRAGGESVLLLLLLASCSHEEVSTYDTSMTGLDIWVGNAAGVVYESTTYNYSYAYEEGAVTFYAQISGMPADHDRTFRIEPFGGDAALMANTIRTEDYVIPAGDGCIVAMEHCAIESAEGIGRRFTYMMHTLSLIKNN